MLKNILFCLFTLPLLATTHQAKAATVITAAETGAYSQPVRAKLRSKNETVLSSGVGARIERLPYHEGDSFKSGAMLVKFDCSTEEAEMEYAKAELKAAEIAVKVNRKLDELKSISVLDLEKSIAELSMAKAKVSIMRAKLRGCVEKAPFKGRIASINVKPHQRVKPGEELMAVVDTDALEVELRVPSNWLRWIKLGTGFKLHIEEVDRIFDANISSIGARVDPVSQTVKVIGEIKTKDESVLPGMSGNAKFVLVDKQHS